MAVEAAGGERERNALDQRQLADGKRRAAGLHPLDPGGDRLGRRGVDGCVVERARLTVEHHAASPCETEDGAGTDVEGVGSFADLPPDLGPVHVGDLDVEHLAEPPGAVVLDRRIPAGLELEIPQRSLEGEAAPVDGGRQREDCFLQPPTHVSELPDVIVQPRPGITHGRDSTAGAIGSIRAAARGLRTRSTWLAPSSRSAVARDPRPPRPAY